MSGNEGERAGFVARLNECKEIFGSVNAWAVAAGVNPTTLHGYFKDREPSRTVLVALANAANVRLEWLATGEGPRTVADEASADQPDHREFIQVPVHSVRASTGYGAAVFQQDESPESFIWFRRDWLRSVVGASSFNLGGLFAQGDSMIPEIQDRDLLMVDLDANELTTEGIYAVSIDNFLHVKYVSRPNPKTLELLSINPAYKPIIIDLEQWGDLVRIVGKVVWVARSV